MSSRLSRMGVLEESTCQQLARALAKLWALQAHTASGALQSVLRLLHDGPFWTRHSYAAGLLSVLRHVCHCCVHVGNAERRLRHVPTKSYLNRFGRLLQMLVQRAAY